MPPFDAARLLRDYGDHGLVRDLAQLLVTTLPPQIDAVTNAVSARDSVAVRAAAHKLRGSIVPFGVPEGVEAARQLEAIAAAGDLSGADALSRELVQSAQSLRHSASTWLATGAAVQE